MAISLPYKLREGQIAYAAKVMANFEALLGAYANGHVDGLGDGDIYTLLSLMYSAAVLANEAGNADQIKFEDGETLVQKFDAGTLNASLLNNEGMFYFYVDPADGHLYVTASEGMEEEDFTIADDGHLLYTLTDPAEGNAVHTYDLGKVKGDKGDAGAGGMDAAVYDPEGMQKDAFPHTGYFTLTADKWGGYFLTYDTSFDGGKTYYTESGGTYTAATVTAGAAVPINTYYEKLANTDCLLTDADCSGGAVLTGHITATTGHALLGPAYTATDTAKSEWAAAVVTGVSQGNGLSATGATNSSPWIKLRALGTVPENSVALMATFYL